MIELELFGLIKESWKRTSLDQIHLDWGNDIIHVAWVYEKGLIVFKNERYNQLDFGVISKYLRKFDINMTRDELRVYSVMED